MDLLVFERYSLRDIRFRMRVRLGFELTKAVSEFENFVKVVSLALGGSSNEPAEHPTAKTAAEAQAQLSMLFNRG